MRSGFLVLLLATAISTLCGPASQPRAGRFLVFTRDLNMTHQALWIAHVDGTHAHLLVRQAIYGALSPDGRWVAYGKCLTAEVAVCRTRDAPWALYLIASSGGRSRILARSTSYPTWSPRSNRIVALRDNALVSVDLSGNVRVLDAGLRATPGSFSPDGKWFVYLKADGTRTAKKTCSSLVRAAVRSAA